MFVFSESPALDRFFFFLTDEFINDKRNYVRKFYKMCTFEGEWLFFPRFHFFFRRENFNIHTEVETETNFVHYSLFNPTK